MKPRDAEVYATAKEGFGGHLFATRCGRGRECRCGICDGALGLCVVCNQGEAELGAVCGGEPSWLVDRVYEVLGLKRTRIGPTG